MGPLEYSFMVKAFAVVILAGISCGCVGTYLVLRRMAFMGEALSHTLLPGMVFSHLKGFEAFWGALGASIVTALGIGYLASKKDLREDTAIGIMLSAMFALGIAMMSMVRSFRDFGSILFGSILGVSNADLYLVGGCTLVVVVGIVLLHKELELSSLDPDYAKLIGTKPARLRLFLLILTALSVVSAVKTIGTLLTTALVIIPPATACMLAKTLAKIIVIASFLAILSGIIGLYVSFYYAIAPGACIVLSACVFFILSQVYRFLLYKKS